jgi:hypothetical protein
MAMDTLVSEPLGSLAREFDSGMVGIYRRALSEAHYKATRFLQMVHENGGVEAASRLLPHMSEGFADLWRRNRLDLTVEALIIQPKWRPLFSVDQLDAAEQRLRECGYPIRTSHGGDE